MNPTLRDPAAEATERNQTERNKTFIREYYEELINRQNLDAIETQIADDYVNHTSAAGGVSGKADLRRELAVVFAAFPDVYVSIDDIVAEGDMVAARATWRGTHVATFEGIPPSRRQIVMTSMAFWRISGGRIVERWATLNLGELVRELRTAQA